MTLLLRAVLLMLCAGLIFVTWSDHMSLTVSFFAAGRVFSNHPYLHSIHEILLFAVLIVCVLVARRDPLFTRIGLLSVLASLIIVLIPPSEIHRGVTKIEEIKLPPAR